MKNITLVLVVTLLLLANTHIALADKGVDVLGTISAINADAGVITVIAADGNVYYVPVPAEKLANMVVGGAVELHGTVAADGSVTFTADDSLIPDPALETTPQDPSADPTVDYYCSQNTDQNPIGADLVTNFGADYAVLQQLACDYHMTWPEIQTLVSNAELLSVDPALLALAAKAGLDDEIIAKVTHSTEADAEVIENLLDQYQENLQTLDDSGQISDPSLTLDDIDGIEDSSDSTPGIDDSQDDNGSDTWDDNSTDDSPEVEDGSDDSSSDDSSGDDQSESDDNEAEGTGYLFTAVVA